MRGRRRAAALSLAALLVTPAVPATAQPAARTLTVTGVANAYTDVTFSSRVHLSTAAHAGSPPRFEGSGTYSGVYVTPLHGNGPAAGTILLRGLPLLSDVPFPLSGTDWLPAGRYRVHLLGDAPATVRIRVDGLRRDVLVRTATGSDVSATLLRRAVAGVDLPVDRTVIPLTVRRPTLTILASSHRSTGFVGRRGICVRARAPVQSPCLQGTSGYGWYYGVIPFDWGIAGAAGFHPGDLPAGEYDAEFFDYTAGASKGMYAFAMTLN